VDVTLRVRSVGSGSGKVAGEGLDCGTGQACSTPVAYGKLVTLQAVADAGSHFDGWEGGVCGNSAACRFNAGPVTSVRARFLPGGASQPPPQPPPTQPPPTQPPPTQPPPPTTRLAVRIVGASAVRVNGRWRVAARVVANQPVRVRGRVGRGRATWADRTFRLPRGTTLVRFQLSRKARAGVCWLRLVATNADGEIRNPQRSVKLGR
jgi:hypothetical protein